MTGKDSLIRNGGGIALGSLVLAGLYLTSLHSYLLFHSLIELFTIIVTAGIFVVSWNARAYIHNNYLLFIGVASVFLALLDLLHTLAYEGMGVFSGDTANLATQLWIAGRYMQSLSWLVAPLFLERRLRSRLQLGAYVIITGLLLLSIFYWKDFPRAYVDGVGLTTFKKISEYVISLFFLGAIGAFLRKHSGFDPSVARLLVLSLSFSIASEIAFTSYVSVYGGANLIGHMLRLIAFYLLYKAIIETGLVKPYAILLRDLKQSEEQLADYAAALKTRNEDLIRSESQLREDAATLTVRNEELDSYAHTVAHNLKNPLCIIIAASDVINGVGDLTPRELRELLREIKSTAFEMDNIIDNLLLLSEVRQVEVPSEAVDMAEVMNKVRSRFKQMLKQYRGKLIYPDSWPLAMGYQPWIEEVWTNYISNALKYGGASPLVEVGATPQPGGMIRFWTRDRGPGLSPAAQASLFTPFTQLRKTRAVGHGLGLSIVLRIMEKLGGQAGVESEIGKGSVFYFTLPAAPVELVHAALERPMEPQPA